MGSTTRTRRLRGLQEEVEEVEEVEDPGDETTDANITRIGDVSLSKVDGSTVCGGTLAGQGFTNELTGTVADVSSAAGNTVNVCGVITVTEEECAEEECLREHYEGIVAELHEFVNNGDLTLAINRKAMGRLPPVPELQVVNAVNGSLTTQNLLLPGTITGNLDWKFFQGSDLDTCQEKVYFTEGEDHYDNLYDCCLAHFQWNVEDCCGKGKGCPELGIASIEEVVNAEGDVVEFYPTWETGRLCDSKPKDDFEAWEATRYPTLELCFEAHFPNDDSCN